MIRKGIWYFILGIIPVAIVLGIPILLYYFLGKEVFAFIIFVVGFIIATSGIGMVIDLFWQEHKKDSERIGRKDE
jgi:uncharacterized membrane protein